MGVVLLEVTVSILFKDIFGQDDRNRIIVAGFSGGLWRIFYH
jgi:hypothetical protein